jgi:uncharacterized protein
MSFPRTPTTTEQNTALRRILDGPGRGEDGLAYDELPGFLFAIATAPVLVKPSEWISDVFGSVGPEFEDEAEAQAVMSAIMNRYNDAVAAADDYEGITPEAVGIDMSSEASLRSWSRGFIVGFSGLHEAWQSVLQDADEEDRERFHALVPVLLVWANPDKYKETNDVGDEELDEFLRVCRAALPATLGVFAAMGVSIYRASLASSHDAGSSQAVSSSTVSRNDPCPCGSGKKYKRCCLIN